MLRILGIDPGSRVTGFGVVERTGAQVVHVAHGTLRVAPSDSLASRLATLHARLAEVIEHHSPDVAGIEQVFVSASPRAALVLGQARGVALAAVGTAGVPLQEYAPSQIKQAVTGSGRAPKDQIQRMVKRLLALSRLPATDAADALAVAICHAQCGVLAGRGLPRRPRSRRSRGPVIRVRRAP